MKKIGLLTLFFGAALALIAAGLMMADSGLAKPKKVELSFVSAYMETHPTVVNAFKTWARDVQDKTQGQVWIKYFNPNTLCPASDNYDSTISGALDIGANYCGMNPGKFPFSEAVELPMIAPSAEAGSMVIWELYKKFPAIQKEYEETKLLWMWTSATFQIHTNKKLVRNLEDLKGLKIIGWSPKIIKVIKALGANPLHIPPTDTYLAIQRRMADGVMCPLAPVRSYKISDAARYHTICDIVLGPFWASMNLDRWNSLSPDVQKVFLETTGANLARRCGVTLDQGAVADSQWMKKQGGHEFYALPQSELARWSKAVQPLHEEWVKAIEAKGYKQARQMLNEAVSLGQAYAKTTGRGYQE